MLLFVNYTMRKLLVVTLFIIFFLLLGNFIPLSFQPRIFAAAQGTQSPTVSNAIVNNYQTNLTLPSGAQEYVYGYVTGGATSSGFAYGQYASVTNAAGNVPAALALTTSNTNNFSTPAIYFAIGGASVSGFSSVSSSYGSNGTPSASSASDTFTVSVPGSLVVVVGEAGGGQSISISGIPGLSVDATNFVPPCNQGLPPVIEIASAYPSVGTYTVTEQTSQCAAGQNPNGTGDLIGVFVFTPSSTTSTYSVTFSESGLPSGTSWSVTFNGLTQSSTGSSITFSGIPPGTYTYTVIPPSGYFASPSSGSVTVTSSNVTEPISFSQHTYSLTIYSEDGGSVTYVYPEGNIEQVPVGGSSTIQVPAGAEVSILAYPSAGYLFSAFKPSGAVTLSQLTPLPGTGGGYSCVATVNGNGAVNVTFIKATFSILATEVGGDNPYTLDFIANATAFANIKSANSASGNNNPYYDYADYLVLYMKNPSAYPIYKVVIYDGSGNQVTGEAEQNILQGVLVWAHMEIFGIYYEGNANNLEPFFSSLNGKIWEQEAILAGLNIVNITQMVNELAADMGPPYGELYSQVVGLILGVLHGEPYLVAEYGDSVAQQIVSQLYQDGLVSSPTQPYDALQLVNEIISNPSSFLQVFPQIYKTAYGTQPPPTALDYANEYVFDFANHAAVGGLTSVLLYFMRNPIFVASGVDTTVTGTIGWTETVTTWTLSGAVTDALVSAAEGAAAGVAATYFAILLEQNIPALLQSEITYEQAIMPLYQGLNASLNQMVTEGEVNLTAAANAQVDATLSESIAAQWFQADYNMTKENVLYWGQNKQQEMSEDQQFAQALNSDVNLDRSFLSSLSAYAQSMVSGGDPPAINGSYEVPTPVESEWTLLPANGMVGFDVNSSTAAFALHFGNYTVYAGANGLNSTYPYAFLLRTQNVTRLVIFGTPSGVYLVNSSSSSDVAVLALQASNATLITKSYVNSSVIAAVPLEERSNNTFEVVPSRYDLTIVIGPVEPPLAAIALNNSVYTFTHGKLMISGLPMGTYSYQLLLPKGYSTSLASGYVNLSANHTLTFVVTRSNSNALYYALAVVVAVSVLAAVFSVGLIRKHSKKGR